MSSYSQSATRRSSSSSTSYTYGIPGSQVIISLNKSGNHTLTLSRGPNPNSKTSSSVPVPVPVADRKFPDGRVGPANTPFCKVCYDAGLPVADYTNHYVKDQPGPGGKVVCPTLLAQKCFKCGVAGHTSSYCPEEARRERERKEREREAKKRMNATDVNGWKVVGDVSSSKPRVEAAPAPVAVAALPAVARNSFGLLAVDDDSSSSGNESDSVQQQQQEEEQQAQQQEQQPAKPLTWAQRAAAAATKAPTTSTTGSGSSSGSSSSNGISITTGFHVPHVVDTRFQLHALCQNISVTQRGSSAKKAAAAANHRGNAAAVAREGSLKRKQESVTIPA